MKNKPKGKSVEGCVKANRHQSVLVETANHFVNFGTLSAPHPLPWQEKDPCTSLGNPSTWRMRIPEAGLMMASDAHTWPLLGASFSSTPQGVSASRSPPHLCQCTLSCLVDAELVIHRSMSALPTCSLQMRAGAGNSRGPSKCS